MSYAASKDCSSSIAHGAVHTRQAQRSAATALPTKIPLGEWTLPALAAPSRAPMKVSVQRNGELKRPESHLGGEYHESRAESI